MDDEFYISLVSNASHDLYPDNTNNAFVNKLAIPLDLKGDYEVCLSEIVHPLELETDQKVSMTFQLSFKDDPQRVSWKEHSFQFNYDPSINISDLLNKLNNQIVQESKKFIGQIIYGPDTIRYERAVKKKYKGSKVEAAFDETENEKHQREELASRLAKEKAARDRLAAEKEEREAAMRVKAEIEAAKAKEIQAQIEMDIKKAIELENAERDRQKKLNKLNAERSEKLAQQQREAAAVLAKEKAEREAKAKAQRETAEKLALQQLQAAAALAKEKAEREAKERAQKEKDEKLAKQQEETAAALAREKAEREAREKAEREAVEKQIQQQKTASIREKAEREALETAVKQRIAKEQEEKIKRDEKLRKEKAEREQAEIRQKEREKKEEEEERRKVVVDALKKNIDPEKIEVKIVQTKRPLSENLTSKSFIVEKNFEELWNSLKHNRMIYINRQLDNPDILKDIGKRKQSFAINYPSLLLTDEGIIYTPGSIASKINLGITSSKESFLWQLGFVPSKFNSHTSHGPLLGDYLPSLSKLTHLMFIYSDIIRGHRVGDKISECLRVVPLTKTTSDDVGYVTFPTEQFYPAKSGRVDSIAIKIADELGEPIPFRTSGKTYVTLKFRKMPI